MKVTRSGIMLLLFSIAGVALFIVSSSHLPAISSALSSVHDDTENSNPSSNPSPSHVLGSSTRVHRLTEHESEQNQSHGQVKVLIFSRARSGSSFLGSLFDRSPNVLYFYEPLWKEMVLFHRLAPDAHEQIASELSALFSCQLAESWIPFYLTSIAKDFLMKPGRGRFIQEMFFGTSGVPNADNFALVRQRLNAHCKSRSHVVAKCIDRLKSLESIEPLWDDRIHVVFLVRDPRAVATSRSGLAFDSTLDLSLDFLCGSALNDIRFLRRKLRDDANSNVVIVRYEDLVHDPQRMINLLFRFVHLPVDSQVTEWLTSTSRTLSNSNDSYSINRDPSDGSSEKWRATVTRTTLAEVQSNPLCQSFMQFFGYIPIEFSDVANLRVRSLNTWYNGESYVDFIRNIILAV